MNKKTFVLHLKKCKFRFNNREQNFYWIWFAKFRKEPLKLLWILNLFLIYTFSTVVHADTTLADDCKAEGQNSTHLDGSVCVNGKPVLTPEEMHNKIFPLYENMKNNKDSFEYYQRKSLVNCLADKNWVNNPSLPTEPVATGKLDIICKFHKFSWQSFAYLTALGVSKKPHFLEMMPKERVFKRKPDAWDFDGDINLVFSNIQQAATSVVLNDWNHNPVFYQQSMNKKFYNDIVLNQLNNSQCINEIDSKRRQFDITAGAIEIKTSWKVLDPSDDASSFFTIHRNIMLNGKLVKNTQLALLGMHIVRKTPKHPEWIWATFEHKDNAPDCDNIKSDDETNWTLYNPNSSQKTNTYVAGQPTQVCRKTPHGAGFLAKAGLTVVRDIKDLNAGMADIYQAKDAIWKNYFLVGSAWTQSINPFSTNGKLPPTWRNEIGGSSLLSNTSIETYVQNPKWFDIEHPNTDRGCFGCHIYNPDKQNALHLSHMFNAAKDYGSCIVRTLHNKKSEAPFGE
ncbi:Cytochrome c family protein [Bathymodiolus thermophilus thioautotrophic gill symbiont]|uniref:hypothetical protein n=1 Tax=Bathymodiolus thermophilus thioautotrophic gill symbiont TaxID=2360 RepID=UPI0010B7A939|nr:hypothetical protein [Bathymodiolus thermophilus thioautotrophic gill symbiont]SGZ59103.1 Cytochrome c family protein [Bathymodiolus thermophilus thioautotrophic gill symbiont]